MLPNPTETLATQARKIVIVIVIVVANVIVIEKMMETEIDVDRG